LTDRIDYNPCSPTFRHSPPGGSWTSCTNTLPIHSLSPPLGEMTEAPAAYVRALDLSVTRLDQTYRRLDDCRYDYTSEGGDFRTVLKYDAAALVVDYPGIAACFARGSPAAGLTRSSTVPSPTT
jgi:hypothetical protein